MKGSDPCLWGCNYNKDMWFKPSPAAATTRQQGDVWFKPPPAAATTRQQGDVWFKPPPTARHGAGVSVCVVFFKNTHTRVNSHTVQGTMRDWISLPARAKRPKGHKCPAPDLSHRCACERIGAQDRIV